jgi:hypothetical protein
VPFPPAKTIASTRCRGVIAIGILLLQKAKSFKVHKCPTSKTRDRMLSTVMGYRNAQGDVTVFSVPLTVGDKPPIWNDRVFPSRSNEKNRLSIGLIFLTLLKLEFLGCQATK